MELSCFYHVFCSGAWELPVAQHAEAMRQAGFPGPLHVGLVGAQESRLRAVEALGGPSIAAEADDGWEQVTLAAISAYSKAHPGEALLYAHTKGSAQQSGKQDEWRESMERRTVRGWRECLAALESGKDAVGCHWLTPFDYPNVGLTGSFFGGNYWMARTDYLATLPLCTLKDRWQAELWIGLGNPDVLDLLPGWPSEELFAEGR